jgi:AMMECR1 domain-containing protein
LRRLRPGADGLILASGKRRALFLPQVWEALPAPKKFVGQLKAKAGLAADDWPAEMRAWRFAAVSVSSSTLADPAALWT